MKYDVFLSCKSEDYKHAADIYDFLVANGKSVFFADKELDVVGDTEYQRVIEDALQESENLVLFASKPEYLTSRFVEHEWRLFVQGLLDNTRNGNLVVILEGIKASEIYYSLKKYQILNFENFEENLLKYVKNGSKDEREDPAPVIVRRRIPGWMSVVGNFLVVFLVCYGVLLTTGYYFNRQFHHEEKALRVDLAENAQLSGSIVTYENYGVTAIYDAEQRRVRDIHVKDKEFEISGKDFLRAASITAGFAVWAKSVKYMKIGGKAGTAVMVGTFIGTLFGYSTGAYIAQQNNKADFQVALCKYLNEPGNWAYYQYKYDERQRIKNQ